MPKLTFDFSDLSTLAPPLTDEPLCGTDTSPSRKLSLSLWTCSLSSWMSR